MNHQELLGELEGLGLPEKAAGIYLTLLGKQRMGVAELVREAGIKRATCYEHLERLVERELVVQVPVGKRTLYSAVPPTRVLERFKKQSAAIEAALTKLEAVHESSVHKPKVAFLEGKRAIKHLYEEIFTTIGDTASIFPPATFFETFSEEEYDEFDKIISGHAFTSHDLFVQDKFYKKIESIRKGNPGSKKLGKKLPKDFASNVDVLIFSDKVALISLRDLSALVIENKDIAELFRSMHNFMWKAL